MQNNKFEEDVGSQFDIEDELDEAQSLAAKYVQRSPTVPIKVNHKSQ